MTVQIQQINQRHRQRDTGDGIKVKILGHNAHDEEPFGQTALPAGHSQHGNHHDGKADGVLKQRRNNGEGDKGDRQRKGNGDLPSGLFGNVHRRQNKQGKHHKAEQFTHGCVIHHPQHRPQKNAEALPVTMINGIGLLARGHRKIQRGNSLTGDVAGIAEDGERITGGIHVFGGIEHDAFRIVVQNGAFHGSALLAEGKDGRIIGFLHQKLTGQFDLVINSLLQHAGRKIQTRQI